MYLTAGDGDGGAGPRVPAANAGNVAHGLASVVPPTLWRACNMQTVPDPDADATAVCLPASGRPDRWQISSYPNAAALERAYRTELRRHPDVHADGGACTATFWGGEGRWFHGPNKPGGRYFCYFEGDDAVIVWTHSRLDQASHRGILASAREGGSDHAGLSDWWTPWHHRIGKAN